MSGCGSRSTAGRITCRWARCYEINNKKMHSVINKGTTDRIHFIFDYVPPDKEPGAEKELPA